MVRNIISPARVSPPTGFNIRQFIGCPFPTNVLLFAALSLSWRIPVFAGIFIADEISMLYMLYMPHMKIDACIQISRPFNRYLSAGYVSILRLVM